MRLAEKRGVEVKEVEKSKENVKVFYDLMLETTKRDSFHGNSLEYYFNLLS
ncbi:MAG: peptidoglycan bridge formation glycyltransferase FemA/FemB family protein [Candidatus Peribacteria bacterium]|nr:peptidoglycan bridge formation glycyltransferase FemA/FemB family protein [Candidatus Peribacteria bacterium]